MSTALIVNDPNVDPFEYVNLNEVDPTFKPVDVDFYTLKVLKAEFKPFTYKSGDHAGQASRYVKFTLAITEHPQHSGRRVFPKPLFGGNSTLRALRRVQDATGVAQVPGAPLEEWLEQLSQVQPEFKAKVTQIPDNRDPNAPPQNDIDWREVLPAIS